MMASSERIVVAVECGGTSFKVAICRITSDDNNEDPTVLHRCRISTADGPIATLQQVVHFLQQHRIEQGQQRRENYNNDTESSPDSFYAAVGIASFGPVAVKPQDTKLYGTILDSSPKLEWRGVDILGAIRSAVGPLCPIRMDTDVNAPAWAEYQDYNNNHRNATSNNRSRRNSKSSCPQNAISSCAYVTIGTGVGVGLVVNGQTVHGIMHPEGGHIPVAPFPTSSSSSENKTTFLGYSWGQRPGSKCPFAGVQTVEGLVSSVALTEQYYWMKEQKKKGSDNSSDEPSNDAQQQVQQQLDRNILSTLPDTHELWDHAAYTIASLCTTLLLTLSMERIVLGGGVLQRSAILLPKIRKYTQQQLNGYLPLGSDSVQTDLERIIDVSRHGEDSGLYGAIVLALEALRSTQTNTHDNKVESSALSVVEKQKAFGIGLWQGIIVGALATALAFQSGWMGRNRGTRRY